MLWLGGRTHNAGHGKDYGKMRNSVGKVGRERKRKDKSAAKMETLCPTIGVPLQSNQSGRAEGGVLPSSFQQNDFDAFTRPVFRILSHCIFFS